MTYKLDYNTVSYIVLQDHFLLPPPVRLLTPGPSQALGPSDLSVSLRVGMFDTSAQVLRTCSLPDLRAVTARMEVEQQTE